MIMPNPVRVALVGYGLAGKSFHAPLIAATHGMILTTIISSNPAKVAADFPGMTVIDSLDLALRDDAVDLVVLATPDALHAPQALAALDAGKHVVIDKPFAPTLAEGRMVAQRAATRGRTLAIFHNRRWDADFLTVRRLIAQDELGDIMQFESHFDRFRPDVTDRWKDQRAAGVWQNLGPHLVDQAVQLFGMPDSIYADIAEQRPGVAAPDYAHILLRYGVLRVILHMSHMICAHDLRFAIHGTRGSYIKTGLDVQEQQSKAGMTPDAATWGIDPQPGLLTRIGSNGLAQASVIANERGHYAAFYQQLRDAIRGSGPNPVLPEQAIDVMTLFETGCTSAREGREIRLS
ncbi:MAG: oxidoreductase [bacterium]|nr:oxidoreductase [bacterium]